MHKIKEYVAKVFNYIIHGIQLLKKIDKVTKIYNKM